MVAGAGLDLFDVVRMADAAARPDLDPAAGILTPSERAWCEASRRPAHRMAVCFAAKEACFKALGTGLVGRMSWRDVDVAEAPDGRLVVHLSGESARVATRRGIQRLHMAYATTRTRAIAWAIAEGTPAGGTGWSEEGHDGV